MIDQILLDEDGLNLEQVMTDSKGIYIGLIQIRLKLNKYATLKYAK